jgi:hypothetical protein
LRTTALTLLRGPEPPIVNPGVLLSLDSNLYTFDTSSSIYGDLGASVPSSVFSSSGSDCSCLNVLKEVHYTVKVTNQQGTPDTNNEPYFRIDTFSATPVIFSSSIKGTCGTKVAVTSKYSIKFETSSTEQS